MKFTKPISREVDIDGNTYIVTLDEAGVDLRVKGKRKSSRVEWARVLEIAGPEQSATTREPSASGDQDRETTPAPVPEDQYDTQPLKERNLDEEAGDRSRSAGAGDAGGPEA
jgi:hypothetical protein